MTRRTFFAHAGWLPAVAAQSAATGQRGSSAGYRQLKAYLDSVPAIDTHDHLRPFDRLAGYVETERGQGMNLFGILDHSYFQRTNYLTPWKSGQRFSSWWVQASRNLDDGRATTFYRYLLPAFRDLYGVDLDTMTDSQAETLDRRIFENYRTEKWLVDVVTRRANIELMFIDPYWEKFDLHTYYKFGVLVLDVSTLNRAYHRKEVENVGGDPYLLAEQWNQPLRSLDEFLDFIRRLCAESRAAGAVSLNDDSTAYVRTLEFSRVSKDDAARIFGRPRSLLTPAEIKAFGDYITWFLAAMSAQYDMPFQIHTGDGRIEGSNPVLLLEMIRANPQTKFSLFHGGFPHIDEIGALVTGEMFRGKNVWLDSNWLQIVSYSMMKRALHEWLEVMPSNRILWGADNHNAEGIYGGADMTRRCLAEVLAEKIEQGNLTEKQGLRIGRQIMRDNALELFPAVKDKLWKNYQ